MVSVVPEAAFPGILCISPLRQEGTARHYKKIVTHFFVTMIQTKYFVLPFRVIYVNFLENLDNFLCLMG